jgi:hypothetical protein
MRKLKAHHAFFFAFAAEPERSDDATMLPVDTTAYTLYRSSSLNQSSPYYRIHHLTSNVYDRLQCWRRWSAADCATTNQFISAHPGTRHKEAATGIWLCRHNIFIGHVD